MKMPAFALMALFFCLAGPPSLMAQKIAYVDADEVLKSMPEYKRTEAELETFSAQLSKQLEDEKKAIARYYTEVIEKVKLGALSPKEQQDAQVLLQKKQEALQRHTAEADENLLKREKALSKPMYQKFEAGLSAIAKANNYMYILDKKLCIYSDGGIDATEQLKKEVGTK